MEDPAEAVVPLRPGFDTRFRGFQREQVLDHLEVLEDQLKLVTIDRNEAVQLNSDLRSLYDSTRQDLTDAEQRLARIESSDTGLPAASQRVQNMLSIAEDEVQTLRDRAEHQAEIIRGSAETEAGRLIEEAESTAAELHEECTKLIAEIETKRTTMRHEYTRQIGDLREREERLRHAVRNAYKQAVEAGRQEADDLVEQARRQCAQWDAQVEQHRLDALEEIRHKQAELEQCRGNVLSALEATAGAVGTSTTTLREQTVGESGDTSAETETRRPNLVSTTVRLPEQREDTRTFVVPLDGNGRIRAEAGALGGESEVPFPADNAGADRPTRSI